jgi:hypothetical protein
MAVNWDSSGNPQVVVGLGSGAVEYYNGSGWSQLKDDGWGTSVNTMEVSWNLTGAPEVLVGLGSSAMEYYNGSGWSQLQGTGWDTSIKTTDAQWSDATWALGSYTVTQSQGAPFVQLDSDGTWSTTGPTTALPGIASLPNLPNLPWASGQPALSTSASTLADGFGLSLNGAGQFATVPVGQTSDNQGSFLVQAPAIWEPQVQLNSGDVREVFNNYLYDWTSIAFAVADGRQNLAFAVTGASQPINQIQPVYQLTQTPGLQVQQQLLPLKVEQTIYTTTTVPLVGLAAAPVASGQPQAFASLRGRSVTLTSTDSGASSQLAGTVVSSGSAAGDSPRIRSVGSLQLGSASASPGAAQGLTLMGSAPQVQAAAITVNGPLAAVAANQAPATSLGLDAGSGTLTLLDSIAPVESLSLSGGALVLPVDGTVSTQVQSISASNGTSSFSSSAGGSGGWLQIQISGDASGDPTDLVISGGTNSTTAPGNDQGIVLEALSGIDNLGLSTTGALQFSGSVASTTLIDGRLSNLSIDAGSLAPTAVSVGHELRLRLTGSEAVNASGVLLQAGNLSLESFGGGQFLVNSPTLSLASNQELTVSQQGSGATSLSLIAGEAGSLTLSGSGDLLVNHLQASGDVSLTTGSGSITLAGVEQSITSTLQLVATAGSISTASGASTGPANSFGSVVAAAGGAITLDAAQLRQLSASSGGAIAVTSSDPTQLSLGSLIAQGNLQVNAAQGSLLVTDPAALQGSAIGLLAGNLLQINTDRSTNLQAGSSLSLAGGVLQSDASALTLTAGSDASGSDGTVSLAWLNLASADALPSLPLITADTLNLASDSGLRLTTTTFHPNQSQFPFQSLAFLQSNATGTGQPSVPLYHPYRAESQLLEDAAGVAYTLDSSGQLITHYDPSRGLYQFTALPQAGSSLPQGLISLQSSAMAITAANLAAAVLPAGVNAADVDLATVLAQFHGAPSGTKVQPASGPGRPLATALQAVIASSPNQASAGNVNSGQPPAGATILTPTAQLLNLLNLDGVVSQTGLVETSPVVGAEVWLESNGDWIHQMQEPLAQTRADGTFRLAVPAGGDGHGLLVSRGGIDSLTGQSLQGLRLVGRAGAGALTPLTTLANLLQLGGVNNERIQAVERSFGAVLTSGDPKLADFDPYKSLDSDGPRALRQAFSHARITALLLCMAPLAQRAQLSPAQEAERLAAAVTAIAPVLAAALADGASALARREAQLALLAAVLDRFDPTGDRALHRALLSGYQRLAEAYDRLEGLADSASGDGARARTLLAASAAIKTTLLLQLGDRWVRLLSGESTAAAWLAELTTSLAQGGVPPTAPRGDEWVRLQTQSPSVLAGGTALLTLELSQPAPDQGLTVQLFIEAPAGSRLGDDRVAAGGQQLTIAAGMTRSTVAIQVPRELAGASNLVVRLVAVGGSYKLDPEAASATVAIVAPGQGSAATAPMTLVGSAANDLLTPADAADRIVGRVGADSFVLRPAPTGQGVDAVVDFSVAERDRFLALRDRFPGATLADFTLLDGALYYRGEVIALVSHDGLPLGMVDTMSTILQIVDNAAPVPPPKRRPTRSGGATASPTVPAKRP